MQDIYRQYKSKHLNVCYLLYRTWPSPKQSVEHLLWLQDPDSKYQELGVKNCLPVSLFQLFEVTTTTSLIVPNMLKGMKGEEK